MLNVIIEINDEDKAFDVKWVMNKESILEVGKDYCPCCYYRLNSEKNKVIKLMNALFKEELPILSKNEKDIVCILEDYYLSLQNGELDFNIVVSKEIIDYGIPLKGITLKEKHVLVEEVSNESLKEKDKEFLDKIRDTFSDKFNKKFLDDASKIMNMLNNGAKMTKEDLWNEDGSPKTFDEAIANVKKRNDIKEDEEIKPSNVNDSMKKMFEIMTSKVKLTREDLFKADGSRRPIDEVYEIVQNKSNKNNDDVSSDLINKLKKAFEDGDYTFIKNNWNHNIVGNLLTKATYIFKYIEKLTFDEMFNPDGTKKSITVVYETLMEKTMKERTFPKNDEIKYEPTDMNMNIDKLINSDLSIKDFFKEITSPCVALEKFKAINTMLEKLNQNIVKSKSGDKEESLKKIFEYGRNKFSNEFASKGIVSVVTENIGKPIRDVEDGGCSKLNQSATTLERVRKTATYDMSKNSKPMYSITLNKSIYLFNNIEIYYLGHGDTFKKYYLNLDSNGIPVSNITIKELETILLSHKFSNVIDFNQQRYLFNTEVKMPGFYKVIPDIVLLMGDNVPTDFPSPEKLIKDVKVTNFYNLVNPVVFTNLTFKRGMEKRINVLVEQKICYVDYVNNMFTFSKNKIEDEKLYKLSFENEMELLVDVDNYLSNLNGSSIDEIFCLTKTACDNLKSHVHFHGRGELKFVPCEIIGEKNNHTTEIKLESVDVYVDLDKDGKITHGDKPLLFSTLIPLNKKPFFKVDISSDNGVSCLEYLDSGFLKICAVGDNPLKNKYYLTKEVCEHLLEMFKDVYFIETSASSFLMDRNSNLKDNTTTSENLYIRVHKGELLATTTPQVVNKFYTISNEQSDDDIKKIIEYFNSLIIKEVNVDKFLITKSALALLSKSDEWSHIKFEEYKNEETKLGICLY